MGQLKKFSTAALDWDRVYAIQRGAHEERTTGRKQLPMLAIYIDFPHIPVGHHLKIQNEQSANEILEFIAKDGRFTRFQDWFIDKSKIAWIDGESVRVIAVLSGGRSGELKLPPEIVQAIFNSLK